MNLCSPARPSASTVRLRPNRCGREGAAGLLDDGDDHLAGDVTAHDEGVDAVEPTGVEELAQAPVRSVDVCRKEDLGILHRAAPRSTSSGSSYQAVLRPTTLRAFQRNDFGASSNADWMASMRLSTKVDGLSRGASGVAVRTSVQVVGKGREPAPVAARHLAEASASTGCPPARASGPRPPRGSAAMRTPSTTSLRLISAIWSLVSKQVGGVERHAGARRVGCRGRARDTCGRLPTKTSS